MHFVATETRETVARTKRRRTGNEVKDASRFQPRFTRIRQLTLFNSADYSHELFPPLSARFKILRAISPTYPEGLKDCRRLMASFPELYDLLSRGLSSVSFPSSSSLILPVSCDYACLLLGRRLLETREKSMASPLRRLIDREREIDRKLDCCSNCNGRRLKTSAGMPCDGSLIRIEACR